MKKLKIIMTGGGTAGHVTPNLALIPSLVEVGYEIQYIGSEKGVEKKLVMEENIKYHEISSGKLRRYFDMKNFSDPFRVIKGFFQAYTIMKKEKPNIVFSKGGFVAVPVVMAAHMCKIPVIAHESDITPGLANRLSTPYCNVVCTTFPEAVKHIKGNKGVVTGTPIRNELFKGSRLEGLRLCGFSGEKPVILFAGGSLGAANINKAVRESIHKLVEKYDVIHLCGKGKLDNELKGLKGYCQFEYVKDDLKHFMTCADFIVSRAGSNFIFEFLALKKPNILVPLSAKASRGDQILNAKSFEKSGYSLVIQDEELNSETLLKGIEEIKSKEKTFISNMKKSELKNGIENVMNYIIKYTK